MYLNGAFIVPVRSDQTLLSRIDIGVRLIIPLSTALFLARPHAHFEMIIATDTITDAEAIFESRLDRAERIGRLWYWT